MLLTSKEASKLLHELESERNYLISQEELTNTFLASVGEDIESCRPEYNYKETKKSIDETEKKIVKLKHAINKFNTETKVEGYDMTIDEMLVYIPQLTSRINKLNRMKNKLPKERDCRSMRSTIIDYCYTNYDINEVKEDYDVAVNELHKAQFNLDKTNVTEKFEVEI